MIIRKRRAIRTNINVFGGIRTRGLHVVAVNARANWTLFISKSPFLNNRKKKNWLMIWPCVLTQ
jgi:hypothetical protein